MDNLMFNSNKHVWFLNYYDDEIIYIRDNIYCVNSPDTENNYLFLHKIEGYLPQSNYKILNGRIFGYDYDNIDLNDEEVLIRRNCKYSICQEDVLFNYTEYMRKYIAINKIINVYKCYKAAKIIQKSFSLLAF